MALLQSIPIEAPSSDDKRPFCTYATVELILRSPIPASQPMRHRFHVLIRLACCAYQQRTCPLIVCGTFQIPRYADLGS